MIEIRDSVSVTLHKMLKSIKKSLPDSLMVEMSYYGHGINIGKKETWGIIFKKDWLKTVVLHVNCDSIKINDKKYYGLAERFAHEYDLDLIIGYYD